MLLERGALLDAGIPALEIVEAAAVRHQLAVAIGGERDRNVAHRESIAGDERRLAELRVEDFHRRRGLVLGLVDLGMIALFRRRADQAPEQRMDRGGGDRELPVHPAAGAGAGAQILGLERAGAVFRGEIAHDRVRFPEDEIILFERGHEPVGIHRQIGGLVVLAEWPADIDPLIRDAELADGPHHLLHVDRGIPPPDFEHGCFPTPLSCPRKRASSNHQNFNGSNTVPHR